MARPARSLSLDPTLPAGFTLDTDVDPTLPAGFQLDEPGGGADPAAYAAATPFGRQVYDSVGPVEYDENWLAQQVASAGGGGPPPGFELDPWIEVAEDAPIGGGDVLLESLGQTASEWGDVLGSLPELVSASAASTVANVKAMLEARRARQLSQPAPIGGEFVAGLFGRSPEEYAAGRAGGVEEALAGMGEELAIARAAQADMAEPEGADLTLAQRGVRQAAISALPSAAAMATGIATKSPALAAATMYPTAAAETFGSVLEQLDAEAAQQERETLRPRTQAGQLGDVERALAAAPVAGALEAGTEALPFGALLKRGTPAVRRLAEVLLAELPGETLATLTQAINEQLATQPRGEAPLDAVFAGLEEGGKQIPETLIATILGSAGQTAPVAALEAMAASRSRTPQAPLPPRVEPTIGEETVEPTDVGGRIEPSLEPVSRPAPAALDVEGQFGVTGLGDELEAARARPARAPSAEWRADVNAGPGVPFAFLGETPEAAAGYLIEQDGRIQAVTAAGDVVGEFAGPDEAAIALEDAIGVQTPAQPAERFGDELGELGAPSIPKEATTPEIPGKTAKTQQFGNEIPVSESDVAPPFATQTSSAAATADQRVTVPAEAKTTVNAPNLLPGDATSELNEQQIASLEGMRNAGGWAQEGGRVLRDEAGQVSGRTSWLPKQDWWQGRPHALSERATQRTIDKLLEGRPLAKRERDMADYLLSYIGAGGGQERRTGIESRAYRQARGRRVADLSPEEMRRELLTHELTGIPNRRAYEEAPKLPSQTAVDVDSLKWVNDNMGHESGNELLKAVGEAIRAETPNAYHLSGDEFAIQANTDEEAAAIMARVNERLAGAVISVTMPDGEVVTLSGMGVSYGSGKDLGAADAALQSHKTQREARGERAGRGIAPPGATRVAEATGRQGDEGAAPAEVSEAAAPKEDVTRPDEAADVSDVELEQQTPEFTPTGGFRSLERRQREQRSRGEEGDSTDELAAQVEGEMTAGERGQAEAIVSMLNGAKNAPRVRFVAGLAGVPRHARTRMKATPGLLVAGLYDPKTNDVYINTDAVKTVAEARWTAAHEIAGHYGLRGLIGRMAPDARKRLDAALELAGQNPTVKSVAAAMGKVRTGLKPLQAIEEALAELQAARRTGDYERIKERYDVDVPPRIRNRVQTVVQRFLERLREIFKKILGKQDAFSDERVNQLLTGAWRYVREGRTAEVAALADETVETHEAYHGSARKFDKFSLEHVGSGEGAQAFGWGLYFAEAPGVAHSYRSGLTDKSAQLNALTPEENARLPRWIRDRIGAMGKPGVESVRMDFEGRISEEKAKLAEPDVVQPHMIDSRIRNAREVISLIDKIERAEDYGYTRNQGAIFKVNIDDAAVAKMLDADEALEDQPAPVRAVLRTIEKALGMPFEWDRSGRSAYARIGNLANNTVSHGTAMQENLADTVNAAMRRELGEEYSSNFDANTSKLLAKYGIPGLRYFDEQSRAPAADAKQQIAIYGSRAKALEHWQEQYRKIEAREIEGSASVAAERINALIGGTRNIVVFDDSIITIKEINGEKVTPKQSASIVERSADDARLAELPPEQKKPQASRTAKGGVQKAKWQPGARYVEIYRSKGAPGAPTRAQVRAEELEIPKEPIRARHVMELFQRLFKVKIYEGKPFKVRGALGYFRRSNFEVRNKYRNDLETAAHEVFHWLDRTYPTIRKLYHLRRYHDELMGVSYDTTKIFEGFAEFGRLFMTQEAEAIQRLPSFYEAFVKEARDAGILDKLEEVQRLMHQWYLQGAEARGRSKIGTSKAPIRQRLNKMADGFVDRAIASSLDARQAAKVIERETRGTIADDAAMSPYKSIRLLAGARSTINTWLNYATLKWSERGDLEQNGVGLRTIFEPIAGVFDEAMGYFVALRADELRKYGKENLLTRDETAALIERAKKTGKLEQIQRAHEQYQQYTKRLLNFAVQSGILNAQTKAMWEQLYQNYVPFYRVAEKFGSLDPRMAGGTRGGLFRKLTGGTANIADVLENITLNTALIVHASLKNVAKRQLFAAIESSPVGQRYAVRIPEAVEVRKVSMEQIERVLREFAEEAARQGKTGVMDKMEAAELAQLAAMLGKRSNDLGQATMTDVQSQAMFFFTGKPPTIPDKEMVLVNGKPVWFQIGDPLLWDMLTDLNYHQPLTLTEQVLGLAKRTLTRGVTLSPEFQIANITRDTFNAFTLSKGGQLPIVDAIKALRDIWSESDAYVNFLANSGGFGNAIGDEAKRLRVRMKASGHRRLFAVPAELIDYWDKWGQSFELATRLAEFKKIRAIKGPAGEPKYTMREAAYQGREISTDFAMRGHSALARWASISLTFFNARLQGLYRIERELNETRGRQSPLRGERALRYASRALSGLTFPALIAYWFLNRGDDDYEELGEEIKSLNTVIPGPDGTQILIPRPFETGALFMEIPIRLLRYYEERDGEELVDAMMFMLANTFNFSPVPQLVAPPTSIALNQQWNGLPVVPRNLENVEPREQFRAWTPDTYKKIGELFNVSPLKLQALWEGYFGTLGGYAVAASDALMQAPDTTGEEPDRRLQQWPLLRRFMREQPYANTSFESRFYDMLDEVDRVVETARKLRREARADDLADYLSETEKAALFAISGAATDTMELAADLNAQMRAIRSDATLSGEEKLKQILELQAEQNRLFNEAMTQFDEAMLEEARRALEQGP
jgi:GGDEF domain-containing protein